MNSQQVAWMLNLRARTGRPSPNEQESSKDLYVVITAGRLRKRVGYVSASIWRIAWSRFRALCSLTSTAFVVTPNCSAT